MTEAVALEASPSIPHRPSRRDLVVKAEAAHELARDLAPWMGRDLHEREIAELAALHLSDNGYKLAKALERKWHIDPDFELVEILEGSWSTLDNARQRAIAAWVAHNNITLDLPIGERVIIESCLSGLHMRPLGVD